MYLPSNFIQGYIGAAVEIYIKLFPSLSPVSTLLLKSFGLYSSGTAFVLVPHVFLFGNVK